MLIISLPFNDELDCIKCGRCAAVTVIWEGISMIKLSDVMNGEQKEKKETPPASAQCFAELFSSAASMTAKE